MHADGEQFLAPSVFGHVVSPAEQDGEQLTYSTRTAAVASDAGQTDRHLGDLGFRWGTRNWAANPWPCLQAVLLQYR